MGATVVFESNATNLVSGGSDYIADVYLRDTVAGATSRVFVNAEGGSITDSQPYPSISANGRCIGFRSGATDLVPGDTTWYWNDAFVYDRVLGTFHRASVSSEGAEGNSYATNVTVAADDDGTCRWVTFTSYSDNLVADDNNQSDDVFIHDLRTGMTWRVVGPNGEGIHHSSRSSAISHDGRFVAFSSDADNLVAGDTNGFSDLYAYDRQTGAIERLSFRPDGSQFASNAMTGSGGAISTDGSRATFDAWPDAGIESQVWLRERDIAAVNTDLTLENVTIWPAQIKKGQPFDVTVTVRNTGAAGHFAVDLYVDPATTPVLCDAGEGGWDGAEVISLGAGGSYTFTRHHDGLAAAGSHALYVQVDSACEIDETSESNNLPAPTGITVLDADYSPDLAVTGVTVIPAAPRPGQTITYQVAVQNLGDATSATSAGLYLGAAPAACPDTPVLTADLPRLEAGASTTVTLVQTLGLTAGTYAAYARVDDSCQIAETNESNNTTPDPGVGFTVSGEQAYPDLVVESSAASPGIIVAGEPITVSVTVRNDGAGGAATSSVFLYVNHAPAGCGDERLL